MSSFLSNYKENVVKNLNSLLDFPGFSTSQREKLYKELLVQNKDSSTRVLDNINLLKSEQTFVVVTGQQLGLLGGPLYTLYKILNTVQLCQYLKAKDPGKNFVPMYWFEAEDADIEEVSVLHKFTDKIERFNYNFEKSNEAVANRVFNNDIERLADFISLEKSPYKENMNWLNASKEFFSDLFNKFGIIGFSSNTDSARILATDFWKIVTHKIEDIKREIKEQSESLSSQGLKNQFKLRENDNFIFYHSNEGRKKLSKIDGYDPQLKYSTNAMLRPLLQDFLLPTVAYVAGDAELSYQQQLETIYPVFNRKQPVLFPRTHVTVINSKTTRLLKKYNIKEIDQLEFAKEEHLKSEKRNSLDQSFEKFYASFKELYQDLSELNFTDKQSMEKILEGSQLRQEKGFEQLQQRVDGMLKKKNEDLLSHFKYLQNILFPLGKLQERVFPAAQFSTDLTEFAGQFLEKVDLFEIENQNLELLKG